MLDGCGCPHLIPVLSEGCDLWRKLDSYMSHFDILWVQLRNPVSIENEESDEGTLLTSNSD